MRDEGSGEPSSEYRPGATVIPVRDDANSLLPC
jgi:hypothetical protein